MEGFPFALRYVPGQRKALSVRPPLRSRAAKRAFRSPSASLRLHYKHISLPFHFTPTSLQAHFAALPLHSDLTTSLPFMQLHSCSEQGSFGLWYARIIGRCCSPRTCSCLCNYVSRGTANYKCNIHKCNIDKSE